MPVRSRREEHKELTRRALLDAAAEQFAHGGYAETTIDAIGLSARVSKGAVYHHFPDKAALFEATYRDRQAILLARVTALAGRRRDAWDRLDAALVAYVDGLAGDAIHRALIAQAPAALGPEAVRTLDRELAGAPLAAALESLHEGGRLRTASAELPARILLVAAREAAFAAAADGDGDGDGDAGVGAARREAESILAAFTFGLRRSFSQPRTAEAS
jgi:AcrR family transcriptional regulator